MFYTHHFSRPETLTRACYWLTELGIRPFQMQVDHQARRLSMLIGRGHSIEVESLINALESSDPHGHPGLWEAESHAVASRPAQSDMPPAAPSRSPISWHTDERHATADTGLAAMVEAMRGAS